MPEHVHLLISERERAKLSLALQMLKQNVARELREAEGGSFWLARYYDFNVWTEARRIEKLRYIHRNPVQRGLVSSPEPQEVCDWLFAIYGKVDDFIEEHPSLYGDEVFLRWHHFLSAQYQINP
jgi:putative transposase